MPLPPCDHDECGPTGCKRAGQTVPSLSTVSVSFSIEEIKHYLEGLCLVGEHKENDMLNCAISLLDDSEDGIEAVLERRKQNGSEHPERR